MQIYLTVFLSVFLAEPGDKTQLATVLFAANPAAGKLSVFLAAATALVASSALAVVVGSRLGGWIAPDHLKIVAGIAFVAIGGRPATDTNMILGGGHGPNGDQRSADGVDAASLMTAARCRR
jgi:putative Ca2+/H+ antiporter (TMEM165/GDT1 family)